jgi:hypothetical protein
LPASDLRGRSIPVPRTSLDAPHVLPGFPAASRCAIGPSWGYTASIDWTHLPLGGADKTIVLCMSAGGAAALPSVPESGAARRLILTLGDESLCLPCGTLSLRTCATRHFGSTGEALSGARRATNGGSRSFVVVGHPSLLLVPGMVGVQDPLGHPRPGARG